MLCLAGIGLIAVDSDLSIGRGDLLTLVCGVIYALQVTACAHYAKADDAILLTMLQLGSSGLIASTLSLGIEGLPPIVPAALWPSLLFLAFGATALALFLQNVGQGLTPSGEAGILLSLESVFGAAASVLFGYEILTGRVLAGFIVVFIAVLAAEWSPRKRQTAAVPRR